MAECVGRYPEADVDDAVLILRQRVAAVEAKLGAGANVTTQELASCLEQLCITVRARLQAAAAGGGLLAHNGSGRHIRERFELQAGLAAPSVVQWRSVGRAAWDVEYKGGLKVRFALRHRARFHQLASSNHRNKLPSEDNRNADFHGCVPYGRTFARFPGDSADAAAVLPDKFGLKEDQLGKRNFTYLPMERGSSMRKFVDNLFKLV